MTLRDPRTRVVSAFSAWSIRGLCWTLAILLDPISALAQTTEQETGARPGSSIAVHVRDDLGGNVGSAQVRVRASSGGQPLTLTTDESGRIVFPGLRSGKYEISVTKAGFQEWRREVNLEGSARHDVAITLEIAGVSESLTVVGENVVNAVNGRGTLPDIQGTVLLAGKKSDAILLAARAT